MTPTTPTLSYPGLCSNIKSVYNSPSSHLNMCHVACSHSPGPSCIPHGNYIPAHVEMR